MQEQGNAGYFEILGGEQSFCCMWNGGERLGVSALPLVRPQNRTTLFPTKKRGLVFARQSWNPLGMELAIAIQRGGRNEGKSAMSTCAELGEIQGGDCVVMGCEYLLPRMVVTRTVPFAG